MNFQKPLLIAVFTALNIQSYGQRSSEESSFLPMTMDIGSETIGRSGFQAPEDTGNFNQDLEGPRIDSTLRTSRSDDLVDLPEIPENVEIRSRTASPNVEDDQFVTNTPKERHAGNAKAIFNAFIATIAPETAWLKTNITRDVKEAPPGHQLGFSKNLGRFSYRPRTWDSLTDSQQQRILKDPRLKAFIISMRDPDHAPNVEFDYGDQERGEVFVDGYLESEIQKMREMLDTLRAEQRSLISELSEVMEGLKGNVTEIKDEQERIVMDLNDAVISLQADHTKAVDRLNATVEDLRENQNLIMAELNDSVEIAIREHQKILENLREQNDEFSDEWSEIRAQALDMMAQAKPIEVVKRERRIGPARVESSSPVETIEPVVPLQDALSENVGQSAVLADSLDSSRIFANRRKGGSAVSSESNTEAAEEPRASTNRGK